MSHEEYTQKGGISFVSFISTETLFALWTFNHNIFKHCFQLSDIVPVCSGYDYRERDPTPVYQYMTPCVIFSPYPLDFVQRFL